MGINCNLPILEDDQLKQGLKLNSSDLVCEIPIEILEDDQLKQGYK